MEDIFKQLQEKVEQDAQQLNQKIVNKIFQYRWRERMNLQDFEQQTQKKQTNEQTHKIT